MGNLWQDGKFQHHGKTAKSASAKNIVRPLEESYPSQGTLYYSSEIFGRPHKHVILYPKREQVPVEVGTWESVDHAAYGAIKEWLMSNNVSFEIYQPADWVA